MMEISKIVIIEKILLWHTQSLLKDSENSNFKEYENMINTHRENLIKLLSTRFNEKSYL